MTDGCSECTSSEVAERACRERDAAIMARIDLAAEVGRLKQALLGFIHAYANVERLDHDHVEVKLFEAWLKGCAVLGIKAEPPDQRPGERPS